MIINKVKIPAESLMRFFGSLANVLIFSRVCLRKADKTSQNVIPKYPYISYDFHIFPRFVIPRYHICDTTFPFVFLYFGNSRYIICAMSVMVSHL
jgi:hypothetical protein